MATERLGAGRVAGLSRARIDLVNDYLAEAHGPAPRAPLRLWAGGEWVEMASPEPELLSQTSSVQHARSVEPTQLYAVLAQTPDPLRAPVETAPTPRSDREPRPPTSDWISEYRNAAIAPIIRERLLLMMQPG
jgi:hypothetical protein